MNDEAFIEISVDLPRERSLDLTVLLDRGTPEKMTGYYEVLFEEGQPSDRTVLKLYFPAGYTQGRSDVETLVLAAGLDDVSFAEKSVNRRDYMEAYKATYEPLRLSRRFGVIPGWHRGTEKESAFAAQFEEELIPLYLDPGLAFGTGHHATTRMMVEFIDKQKWMGVRLLDAGCGSGILSLAALKLGAEFALAFDVDGNAVNAARLNLLTNGISEDRYSVLEGGWDLPELSAERFDVILANITMNIFVEYRQVIDRLNVPRLVVSGILAESRDAFLEIFSQHWSCSGEMEEDGWVLLDLARKHPV